MRKFLAAASFAAALFLGISTCLFAAQVTTILATDSGSVADGKTDDTAFLQAAVDKLSADGGGVVRLTRGTYLSGTIQLKSGVHIQFDKGATMLSSPNVADYVQVAPFTDGVGALRKGYALITAEHQSNVGITGPGVLDGNGTFFHGGNPGDRPFLVRFVSCSNATVSGVTLQHPGAWTEQYFDCDGVKIDHVTVRSHGNGNNDGMDLDSSRNVTVTNCDIDSDDDALCFKSTIPKPCSNIIVTNCRLASGFGAIKFGTESIGGFQNIEIGNCVLHDTYGGGIKLFSVDGAVNKSIDIHDITMQRVDMPIMIRLGERLHVFRQGDAKQSVGSIDGVTFRNINATNPQTPRVNPSTAIFITGVPGYPVRNVTFQNVTIETPGGGVAADADRKVPENVDDYPEYTNFPALPAYGIYLRHAAGIVFTNVEIDAVKPDARPAIVAIDAAPDCKLSVKSVAYTIETPN